ncbi:helix-turn-helix transcriptional regulator (plasmid) [Enterocloster clostridioformis]
MDRKLLRSITFGEQLKKYRLYRHLSQRNLTSKMHLYGSSLSPAVYSKIENGDNNMYITDFIIYMIVVDISFDEFFKSLVAEVKEAAES